MRDTRRRQGNEGGGSSKGRRTPRGGAGRVAPHVGRGASLSARLGVTSPLSPFPFRLRTLECRATTPRDGGVVGFVHLASSLAFAAAYSASVSAPASFIACGSHQTVTKNYHAQARVRILRHSSGQDGRRNQPRRRHARASQDRRARRPTTRDERNRQTRRSAAASAQSRLQVFELGDDRRRRGGRGRRRGRGARLVHGRRRLLDRVLLLLHRHRARLRRWQRRGRLRRVHAARAAGACPRAETVCERGREERRNRGE